MRKAREHEVVHCKAERCRERGPRRQVLFLVKQMLIVESLIALVVCTFSESPDGSLLGLEFFEVPTVQRVDSSNLLPASYVIVQRPAHPLDFAHVGGGEKKDSKGRGTVCVACTSG